MTVLTTTVGEWIDALRSGNYKQGNGELLRVANNTGFDNIEVGYCCLGVLCDVLDSEGWDKSEDVDVPPWHGTYTLTPPEINRQLGGLVDFPDVVVDPDVWSSVYADNDNRVSFAEIADKIEAHLLRDKVITYIPEDD